MEKWRSEINMNKRKWFHSEDMEHDLEHNPKIKVW